MSCDICHGHPNCPCCSDSYDFETCTRCNGTGKILVDINGDEPGEEYNPDDYMSVDCLDCGGDGIVYI